MNNIDYKYCVWGINGCNQQFCTVEEATAYLKQQQDHHHETECRIFHVHARHTQPCGGYTWDMCDISADTAVAADYYAAFNPESGTYIDFNNYPEAREYVLDLKTKRKAITDQGFILVDKTAEQTFTQE